VCFIPAYKPFIVAYFSLVLVQGPYLVRSAAIDGSEIALTGDTTQDSRIEVLAPASVNAVLWNGAKLQTTRTDYGSLIADLATPPTISLPTLASWKWNDSLPERFSSYDDSGPAWVGK
jgi:beta-galactosidase